MLGVVQFWSGALRASCKMQGVLSVGDVGRRWGLEICLIFVVGMAGCAPQVKPAAGNGKANTSTTTAADELTSLAKSSPKDFLLRVVKQYQTAAKYADKGIVRLKFSQSGQIVEETWPSRVSFERPGNMALDAFQAKVRIGNQQFQALVEDAESNNLDQQVISRPLAGRIRLEDFIADPILGDILASQLQRQPLQLELLLDSKGLESVIEPGKGLKHLGMESFDGHACQLIELATPSGAFQFWVDPQKQLIRRLDYPVATLLPDLATNPDVKGLRLSAELVDAKLGDDVAFTAETFVLGVPDKAKKMRTFVLPPRPLPSKLFGKVPDDFWFTRLGGGKLTRDDMQGKISVLVWFRNHPACVATLQQLEQARKELASQTGVQFLAINTDDSGLSDDALQQLLAGWDVDLELVRDLEAFGDKAFHIAVQPTAVVLSKDLNVQVFQPGGNPLLANQMVVIAERLLAGDRLDEEILKRADEEQTAYEKVVSEGGITLPEKSIEEDPTSTALHQPLLPKHLTLDPLWQRLKLQEPGNIYWKQGSDDKRLVVIDGTRRIAELDMEGEIVHAEELKLPKDEGITYLRQAKNESGKTIFLAGSPGATKLFLFDENWQLLGSYPPEGALSARVFDVLVVPQATGGDLICVGFADLLGVHAIDTTGKVLWKSRACPTTNSLALRQVAEEKEILTVSEGGDVLPLSLAGKGGEWIKRTDQSFGRLVSASFSDAVAASLLGIVQDKEGKVWAVGLDSQLKDQWKLPLPLGGHEVPIEPIVTGQLRKTGAGEWLIASPNGCVHIMGADGSFQDIFAVGQVLHGICVGDDGRVFYTSNHRIDAVRISEKK